MDVVNTNSPGADDIEPDSRPLPFFLPVSGNRPIVVMLDLLAVPVVIMRTTAAGFIEVLPPDGPTLMLSGDCTAIPITDPALQADCLASAAARLREETRCQATQLSQARADLTAAKQDHADVLDEIRTYAIRKHEDGDICRGGLNAFLYKFNLNEYQPRVRINYTITGSYEVDRSNPDAAQRDADYVRVDLSRVDNVVDDTSTSDVVVTDVETIDD